MTKKVFFYILIDPITNEICYIGRTANPEYRYYQHCRITQWQGNVSLWLETLSVLGVKPIMTIINVDNIEGSLSTIELVLIERYWDMGCPLLNHSNYCSKNHEVWKDRMENSKWYLTRGRGNFILRGKEGNAGERWP